MEDLDIAYLVLLASSAADGGCIECVQGCVDEAIHAHPELPWEDAVKSLLPESTRSIMAEAVTSSRGLLVAGSFPESESDVDYAPRRSA